MNHYLTLMTVMVLLSALFAPWGAASAAATEQVVFYVAWYDVGKAALEGLPGVHNVTRGWRNFREINTVDYDPAVITVDRMIEALKEAGTFKGVAK